MLLKNLSDKVNKTEGTRGIRAPSKPARERSIPPSRQEAFDPTQLSELPSNFVTRIVDTQDRLPEKERHNTGHMHLSALLKNPCVRQMRFNDTGKDNLQSVTGGHRLVWALGRAVEKHVRDSYIKGVKGKGVLGNWSCLCGAVKHEGLFSAAWQECQRCRAKPTKYSEYTVFDHDAGISGNPDFPIYIGDTLHVVEMKSMNGEQFDALTAPLPDHIYQAAGYRRMLINNNFKVSNTVIIHYTTKKFMFGSPYKEYHVDVNKPQYDNVLDGMWAVANAVKASRAKGTIPKERVCSSINSPQAKNCPHITECWMRG